MPFREHVAQDASDGAAAGTIDLSFPLFFEKYQRVAVTLDPRLPFFFLLFFFSLLLLLNNRSLT